MFNWIKGFVFGFIAGVLALALLGLTHHVVRTPEGFRAVRKDAWTLEKAYVDTRAWGPVDYVQNRDVVAALARAGYQQKRDALERTLEDAKKELERNLKRP